jgi:hypothetical protein
LLLASGLHSGYVVDGPASVSSGTSDPLEWEDPHPKREKHKNIITNLLIKNKIF